MAIKFRKLELTQSQANILDMILRCGRVEMRNLYNINPGVVEPDKCINEVPSARFVSKLEALGFVEIDVAATYRTPVVKYTGIKYEIKPLPKKGPPRKMTYCLFIYGD